MEKTEKSHESSFTATLSHEKEDEDKKTKVSSTAIVKYEAQLPVLPYAKLQQDTDLNIAPANWLRDGRFSNTFPTNRNPLEFSSFGIAHTFLDNIGDVDVISDAENIKKLLKMAYSKAELSLVVHRIGKTLLLDELDLPAILTYVSETKNSSGLRWLYDFYCEQRGIPKDSDFKRKKNKDEAKQKNIFSKFLHYSIQRNEEEHGASSSFSEPSPTTDSKPSPIPARHPGKEERPVRTEEKTTLKGNEKSSGEEQESKPSREHIPPSCKEGLNVFPANEEDILPEPHQMSSFQRNILWTFEDLHMLVGSNVPIFGGGKYPAVSLRLRDCGKPINVLTGLDYWLDNLMCNVPEVAMCYHLDGLVQYYDLFKTEDLPHLEGSSFSPKVVKDIAQNVLSFMKSNCTQEGHTYWLFKASDSEVVKLYDLTSICDQNAEKYQNPFTVPVGMLFYRVAKNMMKQETLDAGDQSIVKLLLDSCLGLLDDKQFPEIMTSANILLSNLFSPDNIHTMSSLDKTSDSKHASQEDLTPEIQTTPVDVMAYRGSLEVGELSTPGMYQDDIRQIAKTITNNVEIRCKKALSYIVEGLRCLKLGFATDEEAVEMDTNTNKDDGSHGNSPPQGSHGRSGPQTFSVRRLSALEPSSSRPSSLRSSDECNQNSLLLVKPVHWRSQSKGLLMRKATSVYHSMSCLANTKGKFGRGLRFSKISLECLEAYKACGTNKNEEDNELMRSILSACADSYLMLAKSGENLEVHHDEFLQRSRDDKAISSGAKEFICDETGIFNVEFKSVVEDNLVTSADFYAAALEMTSKQTKQEEYISLARRVGNVKNELGVYFMNRAALMVGNGEGLAKQRDMWKKSFLFFESGIKAFEAINDKANLALLHSNTGRLMRLCAQAVRTDKPSKGEFSSEEKTFYKQAIEFYNRALQSLAERKVCVEVWDAVTWELSGAYFTMATLLQDYPPLSVLSQQEVEKEITELMMKALKLCEPTGKGSVANIRPQSPEDLNRRLGSIHHRLASLYHNTYRNESVDQARKKVRSLAELHYSKACSYFKASSFPCEWIRIHLERVALCEHQVSLHGSSSAASIKILQTALDCVLESRKALEVLTNRKDETSRENIKGKEFVKVCEDEEEKTAMNENKTTQLKTQIELKEERLRSEKSNNSEDEKRNVVNEEEQETKRSSNAEKSTTGVDERRNPSEERNTRVVNTDGSSQELNSEYLNELKTLIPILEGRLNYLLKEMVKFWNTKKGKNKELNVHELDKAKRMYSMALRGCVGKSDEENCVEKGIKLVETLEKIEKIKLETQ